MKILSRTLPLLGAAGSQQTPSPPSDGGEGRGEEGRCVRIHLSSVLFPLLRRGERKKNSTPKNLRSMQKFREIIAQVAWNPLPRAATLVCLVLPTCIGFVETASAHDPGLSSVAVKGKGRRLEAGATFPRKDSEGPLRAPPAPAN